MLSHATECFKREWNILILSFFRVRTLYKRDNLCVFLYFLIPPSKNTKKAQCEYFSYRQIELYFIYTYIVFLRLFYVFHFVFFVLFLQIIKVKSKISVGPHHFHILSFYVIFTLRKI